MPLNVRGEGTHSAGDGQSGAVVRRRDNDILTRRLSEIVSQSTLSRPQTQPVIFRISAPTEAEQAQVDAAAAEGVPTGVTLVAIRAENGLAPKDLNTQVEALKAAVGAEGIDAAAREVARMLNNPPSKLREKYLKDGVFDFDALAKDLGLEGEAQAEMREALRKALGEDPTAPLEDPDAPTDPSAQQPGTETNDEFVPLPDDGSTFDPTQGELGNGALDNFLNQNDLIEDDGLNDLDPNKDQGNNDKNNNKNNVAKAPNIKGPSTKVGAPPPSFPPISANFGGGGSKGGQPPQMPPLPPPVEPPPFQMPPPPPEGGISAEVLAALLGPRGGESNPRSYGDAMAEMLKAYADMNQATIAAILQLGTMMMSAGQQRSQLTYTPPAGNGNVSGGAGGSIASRLSVFAGGRTTGRATPRTNGGAAAGQVSQALSVQSPRSGSVPGYAVKAAGRGRSIVKPKGR